MAGFTAPLDPAVTAPRPIPGGEDGEILKGLRGGALDMGSKLQTFAGGAARAAGFNDFAAARDAQAKELEEEAQSPQNSLRMQSWDNVHGVNDFLDYIAGQGGAMAPAVGVGLGAAGATALTGGGALAGIAGMTAAMAPQEIGAVLQRQAAEGQPQNFGRAAALGTLSSAAMNVVPALAGRALLGQGIKAGSRLAEQKALGALAEKEALRRGALEAEAPFVGPQAPRPGTQGELFDTTPPPPRAPEGPAPTQGELFPREPAASPYDPNAPRPIPDTAQRPLFPEEPMPPPAAPTGPAQGELFGAEPAPGVPPPPPGGGAVPGAGPLKFPEGFDPAALPKMGEPAGPSSPMPGLGQPPAGAVPPAAPGGWPGRPGPAVASNTEKAQAALARHQELVKQVMGEQAAAAKSNTLSLKARLALGASQDAVGQGVGMAAGEAAQQYGANPDKPLDWEAIRQAGAGGVAVGFPLGALHAGAHAFHQGKADFVQGAKDLVKGGYEGAKDLAGKGAQKAKEAAAGGATAAYGAPGAVADAAPGMMDKVKGAYGAAKDMFKKGVDAASEATGKDIAGGAGAVGKTATTMTKEGYKKAVAKAQEVVDRFNKAGEPVDDSIEKAVAEGSPLAGMTEQERATITNPVADEETKNTILDNARERVDKWAKGTASELAADEGASKEARERAAGIAQNGSSTADKMWLGTQKVTGAAKRATKAAIDALGKPIEDVKEAHGESMAETDVASKAMVQAKEEALARGATEEEANTAAITRYNEEIEKAGERLLQSQEEKAKMTPRERAAKKRGTLGLKKSEDADGPSVLDQVPHVVDAIQEHLFPLLPEHMMDGSPGSLQMSADFVAKVRKFLNTASKPAGHNFLQIERDAEGIRNILGGDADKVDAALMKVYAQAMMADPKDMQRLTSQLYNSREAGVSDRELVNKVTGALKGGLRGSETAGREFTELLKAYARGDTDLGQDASMQATARIHNAAIKKKLQWAFGDRYEEMLDAAERNMNKGRERAEMAQREGTEGGLESDRVGEHEPVNPNEAPADDHEQWVLNSKQLLARPRYKSEGDLYDNSSAKFIDQMKVKHPNAEVEWVSERERTGDDSKPADRGRVRIRNQAQEGEMDHSTIREMKLDTDRLSRDQKNGKKPSPRIDVDVSHLMEQPATKGGELTAEQKLKNEGTRKQLGMDTKQMNEGSLILDAVQMTRQGMDASRGITKSGGETDAVRMARGFYNAVSQLTEKLGTVPAFKENTLLGYVNGKPFTVKDAREAKIWGPDDVKQREAREQETANRKVFTDARKGFETKINELREQWHAATTDQERATIQEKGVKAQADLDAAEAKLGEFNKAAEDVQSERVGQEHARQSGEEIDLEKRDLVQGLLEGEGRYEMPKDANIHDLATTEGDRAPMFAGGMPEMPVKEMKNGKWTGNFVHENRLNEKGEWVSRMKTERVEQGKKTAEEIGEMDTKGAGSTGFQQDSNRPGMRDRPQNVHPWKLALEKLAEHSEIGARLAEKIAAVGLKRNANMFTKEERAAITEALGGNRDAKGRPLPDRDKRPVGVDKVSYYATNGWLGDVSFKAADKGGTGNRTTKVETKNYGNFWVTPEDAARIKDAYENFDPIEAQEMPLNVARVAKVVNPILAREGRNLQMEPPGVPAKSTVAKQGTILDKNGIPISSEGYATKAKGRSELANQDIMESTRMPRDRQAEMIPGSDKSKYTADPNYKGKDKGTYGPNLAALIKEHEAAGLHDNAYGQQYTAGGEKLTGTPNRNAPYFGPIESKTGPAGKPTPAETTAYQKAVQSASADPHWYKNYHDRLEYLTGIGDADGLAQLERLRQGVKQFGKDGTYPEFKRTSTPAERAAKATGAGDEEGSQGPKAVAAKKAALEEAASSYSPELIHEIRTTTDSSSLQASVNHLNEVTPVRTDRQHVAHIMADAARHGDVARMLRDAQAVRDQLQRDVDAGVPGARGVQERTTTKLDSLVKHRTEAMGLTRANEITNRMAAKGAQLRDVLDAIHDHLPPHLQEVARSIRDTLGDSHMPVGHMGANEINSYGHMGQFNMHDGHVEATGRHGVQGVRVNPENAHFSATVLLHEGVHAATMEGMHDRPAVRRGMEALMHELVGRDPTLALEYGFKDAYEFAAEALTNAGLQERLQALPALDTAGKETTGWGKFVDFVKGLLGFKGKDPTALNQAMEMTSYAMKKTRDVLNRERTIDEANARLDELMHAADNAYESTLKYSHDAEEIHEALGAAGFAATHDSPIRHAGEFNWREHSGKGEGNASYGAGTYLSTGEGVHRSYKDQFTAKVNNEGKSLTAATRAKVQAKLDALKGDPHAADLREQYKQMLRADDNSRAFKAGTSPTYEVSVDIPPEQLLKWNKPFSEQSEHVKSALTSLGFKDSLPLKWTNTEKGMTGTAEGAKYVIERTDGHAVLYRDGAKVGEYATALLAKLDAIDKHGGFASGESIYNALAKRLRGSEAASDALQKAGILGHVYNAEGGNNATHPNYVIFDDSKINTNYVRFSQDSRATSTGAGPRDVKGALDYLHRVLRNSIGVDVHALLGKGVAGTWDPVKNLLRISVHQLNVKSVAYHESLHALFTQLYKSGNAQTADVLMKAGQSAHIQKQMREYFKDKPAVLESMTRDPEEAAAYMYQLWKQGDLKMNPQATTIFGKIAEFIQHALGVWSNDKRALHIMEHFDSGEYAKSIGKPNMTALLKKGTNPAFEMSKGLFSPAMNVAEKLFASGNSRLRDMGLPAMNEIADLVKTRLIDRKGDPGYLAAARQEHAVRMNALANEVGNISPAVQKEAMAALQRQEPATSPEAQAAVTAIRNYLDKMRDYVDPEGKWANKQDYFPRVWDVDAITRDPAGFMNMIEKYQRSGEFKGDPAELIRTLTANGGNEFSVDTRMPGFQSGKERVLDFISGKDAEPFLHKDMYKTMNDYTSQATRRVEFGRRFGEKGEYLDHLMKQAKLQGATPEQLATAESFMKGINGTLGDGINPTARRWMGNMTVYQNLRVLPLSVFSSVVDPLGIMMRGGTVGDAWSAYKRIVSDIPKVFKDSGIKDWQTSLAETLGVVENSTLAHAVGAMYTQGMVGNLARKINDTYFKYNLMETVNRSTRIQATEGALKFMDRHTKEPNAHSQRYLDELGLKKGDVQVDPATGRVKTSMDEGLTQEQADRMRQAVHQWVDGAVLRPDNADRPIWFNDPHFMLLSHLKSFTYSFHHTIIDRMIHEAKHGNYQPMAVMASYVPVMIAADFAKGLIQGGGQQPDWKKNWGPAEYGWSGLERSGAFGVGQFGIDVAKDISRGKSGIGALSGPTFDQLGEAFDVAGGRQRFGKFALDSMPANAAYAGFIKGHSVSRDPIGAE